MRKSYFLILQMIFGIGILCFFESLAQPITIIENKKDACDGLDNGSLDILVTAATSPPLDAQVFGPPNQGSFSLESGVPFTVSGLPGDSTGRNYVIIVQDATGSTVLSSSIFSIADDLLVSLETSTSNTDCTNPDGAIDVNVSGGTGNYSFQWTGPADFVNPGTEDLANIPGGDYTLTVSDNGTNCIKTLGPITITDPSPIMFNLSTGTPSVCIGSSGILNLSNSEGAAVSYEVYRDGVTTGITLTGINAPLTISIPNSLLIPAASYTFTVEATNRSCTPLFMNGSGVIVVHPIPIAPTVTFIPDTYCIGNAIIPPTVTTPVVGSTYRWYGDAGLTTLLTTGATPTSVQLGLNTTSADTTTMFVTETGSGNCEGLATTVTLTVNVVPAPPDITFTPNTYCIGGVIIPPTVTTPVVGHTYRWYGDAGLTRILTTGTTPTNVQLGFTSALAGTTTVFVTEAGFGNCESLVTPVNLTIDSVTATISGDSTVLCPGFSASILVTFTGPGTTWDFTYTDGSSNFNLTANSNPFSFTVNPMVSTTYSLVSVVSATSICGAGVVSGTATVTIGLPPGDPDTFGSESWIGYVYNDTGDQTPNYDSSKYRGFINDADISNLPGASIYNDSTDAFEIYVGTEQIAGPNLCGSYSDHYSIRFRMRKTFAAGSYVFTIGGNDGLRLFIDGGSNLLPANAFIVQNYTVYTTAPQCLTAGTHDLVIEYFEAEQGSEITFNYSAVLTPMVNTPEQVHVCINSASPTLTVSSAGALDFNWYTDAALTTLISTGTSYTPVAPELDITVVDSTDFFVTAVHSACGETSARQVTVNVIDEPDIILPTTPVQICDVGGMVGLDTLVSADPAGGIFSFAGTGITASPTFDPSLVTDTTTISVDYAFGTCTTSTTFDIDLVSEAAITVPTGAAICEPLGMVGLDTLVSGNPAGGIFSFAGTGVTASDFDPTGLSGVTTITVDYTIGGCTAPQQMFDINVVNPGITLDPTPTMMCPMDSQFDLTALVSPSSLTGGTFTFSGTGVVGSGPNFDPSALAGSIVNINVNYSVNGCSADTVILITVRASDDPICGGDCSTVSITPIAGAAICSPTEGSIMFDIVPAVPIINNTGVRLSIVGTSSTNLDHTVQNTTDFLFENLPVGNYDYTIEYGDSACIKTGQVTVLPGPDLVDFITEPNNAAGCFGNTGGVVLSNINGASTADYMYEIKQLGSIVSTGTITQSESLTDVTLTGFEAGDFEIKLSQDQGGTCSSPAQSAFKPFTIAGATANLDTLYITKTMSVADLPTGLMIVGISESMQEPYEARLELRVPVFPNQVFAQDFTVASRNPLNLRVEFKASNIFAGEYLLSIRDAIGCQKDYVINIGLDLTLAIPNVFTPNGDGVNEVFFIGNLPEATKLFVINRWGKEVFSSNNYENNWNGGSIEDGVYFYKVNTPVDSYTGWVEIMR